MTEQEKIEELFKENGWSVITAKNLPKEAGLENTFRSGYAVVAVSVQPDVEGVVEHWPALQSALSALRDDNEVGKLKDLYLVFIIREISPSRLKVVEDICGDTNVCRKMCLELADRDIESVLMTTPFLSGSKHSDETSIVQDSFPDVAEETLQDLARKSKEYILDRLLKGDYDSQGDLE